MSMKDEMQRYLKTIEISQEINRRANQLIKNNSYSDFTRVQLRMIAELSANRSIEASREAKKSLKEWESDLNESKELFGGRHQPVYEGDENKDHDNSL